MRHRLVCAVAGLLLLPASGASAAETFDAGAPLGAPVLTATGVAWSTASGQGSRLLLRTGATQATVASSSGSTDDEGFYGTRNLIRPLSAAGDRIGYTVATYDNAESKYSGGDGLVAASAAEVAPGGAPTSLTSCGYGQGVPSVALGAGFSVIGGCYPKAFDNSPANVPSVSINGAVVGSGGSVQAAGPYAAWVSGSQVVVREVAGGAQSTVASAGPWALLADGSVAVARGVTDPGAAAPGPAQLQLTPLGGEPAEVAGEPGGIFGLTGGGDALAYTTSVGPGELAVVVRRGATRVEVGRLWRLNQYSPDAVAVSGTRVVFQSPRCGGGTDLTLTTVDEPAVDRRVGPCPVAIEPTGGLTRRRLSPLVSCDGYVPPTACTGTVAIRAGGRLLARGVFRTKASNVHTAPLRLTAAGRRAVAGLPKGGKLRARVQVARDAGPTSSRTVAFSR